MVLRLAEVGSKSLPELLWLWVVAGLPLVLVLVLAAGLAELPFRLARLEPWSAWVVRLLVSVGPMA
jgi:hypothetical protein